LVVWPLNFHVSADGQLFSFLNTHACTCTRQLFPVSREELYLAGHAHPVKCLPWDIFHLGKKDVHLMGQICPVCLLKVQVPVLTDVTLPVQSMGMSKIVTITFHSPLFTRL
jgi:hypothetical protein